MTLVIGSLQLGFLYGLLAIGIYISFRILNVPDLTAEGSFTFGLTVSAACCAAGGSGILGIVLSAVAGAAAGAVTGLLQTRLKIHPILAGIITMTGLYSINLMINGQSPNVSLLSSDTFFKDMETFFAADKNMTDLILCAVWAVLVLLLMIIFFGTHAGMCIRATGDNEDMVRASSINVDVMKILALAVSNACIGLSGGLIAQYQGYADINSGAGTLVVGLASVIIGEALFGKHSVKIGLISAVGGSLVYRFIMAFAIKCQIFPSYCLKLVSAVIVAVALALPAIRENMELHRIMRASRAGGKKDA